LLDFTLTVIFKIIWNGQRKLNEYQRREYLSAMGIELFYPTDEVETEKARPGMFVRENDPEPQTIDRPKEGSVAEETSQIIHRNASFKPKYSNQLIEKEISVKNNPSDLSDDGATNEHEPTLSFSLNYYFLSDKLAVLEETTTHGSVFHRKEYLDLLRNIVSALGIDVESQSFNTESVSWPVAGFFSLPTDQKSAAQKMLYGYIRRKSQEAQFANLLVFADTIPDLFTNKRNPDGTRDYFNEAGGFYLTICQALGEMLIRPELKKSVWNSLQELRKRIMFS